MRHDLAGDLVGQLGAQVAQSMKPTPDPDARWETGGNGIDQPRCSVAGHRGGQPHPAVQHVAEGLRPARLGLLVAHG
jgi:hypothetical protein